MWILQSLLMTALMLLGLFLIGLILLQRGRGGGLAGAFGGMGGQSAFGTKAGDVFTRITIGVAAAWILLCAGSVVALHQTSGNRADATQFKKDDGGEAIKAAPKDTDEPALGTDSMAPATNVTPDKKSEEPANADATKSEPPAKTDVTTETKTEAPKAEEKKTEEPKSEAKPAEEKKAEEKPAEEKKPEAAPEKPAADPKPAEPAAPENKPAEPKPESTPEKKPE